MVRLFRHGDGTLSHFNGMGVTAADHLATLLTYDDMRSQPIHIRRFHLSRDLSLRLSKKSRPGPVQRHPRYCCLNMAG